MFFGKACWQAGTPLFPAPKWPPVGCVPLTTNKRAMPPPYIHRVLPSVLHRVPPPFWALATLDFMPLARSPLPQHVKRTCSGLDWIEMDYQTLLRFFDVPLPPLLHFPPSGTPIDSSAGGNGLDRAARQRARRGLPDPHLERDRRAGQRLALVVWR